MSDSAIPDEHKGRLAAMQKAARILREHFDIGFVVVSHEEAGLTRFATTEWGNRFALCKLADDYADGDLELDLTEPVDDED